MSPSDSAQLNNPKTNSKNFECRLRPIGNPFTDPIKHVVVLRQRSYAGQEPPLLSRGESKGCTLQNEVDRAQRVVI